MFPQFQRLFSRKSLKTFVYWLSTYKYQSTIYTIVAADRSDRWQICNFCLIKTKHINEETIPSTLPVCDKLGKLSVCTQNVTCKRNLCTLLNKSFGQAGSWVKIIFQFRHLLLRSCSVNGHIAMAFVSTESDWPSFSKTPRELERIHWELLT